MLRLIPSFARGLYSSGSFSLFSSCWGFLLSEEVYRLPVVCFLSEEDRWWSGVQVMLVELGGIEKVTACLCVPGAERVDIAGEA